MKRLLALKEGVVQCQSDPKSPYDGERFQAQEDIWLVSELSDLSVFGFSLFS